MLAYVHDSVYNCERERYYKYNDATRKYEPSKVIQYYSIKTRKASSREHISDNCLVAPLNGMWMTLTGV